MIRKAVSFLLAIVLIVGLFPMSAVVSAADSYTQCPLNTVSWQMIYDNPGFYYWTSSSYSTYYLLTAVTTNHDGDSGYFVKVAISNKRYIKKSSNDDSSSSYDWGSASYINGEATIYYKTGTTPSSGGGTSTTTGTDYVLVTTPTSGKKYIICDKDEAKTGKEILTGTGGTATTDIYSSSLKYNGTPYITATDESCVFTFEGTTSSFTLKNSSGSYLKYSEKGNKTTPITDSTGSTFKYTGKYVQMTASPNYYLREKSNEFVFYDSNSGVYFYEQQTTQTYTVTYKTYDGSSTLYTTLYTETVASGSKPTYSITPTRTATAQYTYTFAGWSTSTNSTSGTLVSNLPAVTGNVTYYAAFTSTLRSYTITWSNIDGNDATSTSTFAYGSTPSYSGTPTKAADAQYTYTFAGWSSRSASSDVLSSIPTVTGAATYYAVFTATPIQNTYELTVDSTNIVVNLTNETFTGASSESDFDTLQDGTKYAYVYPNNPVFKVNGEAKKIGINTAYRMRFVSDDESIAENMENDIWFALTGKIGITTVKMQVYEASTRETVAEVTLTVKVEVSEFTVTWVNEDGTVLETDENVPYGTTPSYDGDTPTKASTAQYDYAFAGWTPEISAVSGNTTYTATYTSILRSYTITWQNDDGTTIDTTTVQYGQTPTHANPSKTSTAQYSYTFAGWTPEISAVSGDTTYTATYTENQIAYTVTWKNQDGSDIGTTIVNFGEKPTHDAPTKNATAEFTYTFSGWAISENQISGTATEDLPVVTGNITYYAAFSSTKNKYAVKFVNYDGTVLQNSEVEYGITPTYAGTTPTKASTAQYSYTFNGWSPDVSKVTGEATYTAQFESTVNEYTITWVDGDGKTLKTELVSYGAMPSYSGETPTKTRTDQYTYAFNNTWSPDVSKVTGDATYTATYTEIVNKYTVIWKNEDGAVLETDENVVYGETPSYDGDTPTKTATAEYTYTFAGWSPVVADVTDNIIYTATYSYTKNQYTVKFVNEDGTELQSEQMLYGVNPEYRQTMPTKEADAQYTYTFAEWDKEIVPVTEDVTYTATYNSTVNTYTVTWVNEYGIELEKDENVAYGTMPSYDSPIPRKSGNAEHNYVFAGWTPEVSQVTGDITYTTVYTEGINTYTVEWVNENGDILETDENVPYGIMPTYNGETPTKADDEKYSYTFDGWTPEISSVTGDITYKAAYTAEQTGFRIIFEDYTNNKAYTDIVSGSYRRGVVTFTVESDLACVLAVHDSDDTYTRLKCMETADGKHQFTVTVDNADIYIVVVLKGDTNLDGRISVRDAQLISRAVSRLETFNNLQTLVSDVDVNGSIRVRDAQYTSRVVSRLDTFVWDIKI